MSCNGQSFYSLCEAKVIMESWRRHYNALGDCAIGRSALQAKPGPCKAQGPGWLPSRAWRFVTGSQSAPALSSAPNRRTDDRSFAICRDGRRITEVARPDLIIWNELAALLRKLRVRWGDAKPSRCGNDRKSLERRN